MVRRSLSIKPETRVFLCPTDTIYGLSARFNDEEAIERIRKLKNRPHTRFIILLSDLEDLHTYFSITLSPAKKKLLSKIWPGPYTVAFSDNTAFRIPDYPELRALIKAIGPIVSTSANKHKSPPVKTVAEAKALFGNAVDEYLDVGPLEGEPSTILRIIR